ncbi:MAG: hypothetical protein R3B13_24085 [Polyangiaceae bacterium]
MRLRGPRPLALLAVSVFALLNLAPTPGDIGGCGQEPTLLDPPTFFANKKVTDCERCDECGLASDACDDACDPKVPFDREFPAGCLPLVHDGEVCLRALLYASCDDYGSYMSDTAPSAPSECNFCPPRGGVR